MKMKFFADKFFRALMVLSMLIVFAFLGSILITILKNGWPAMSWDMVTQLPGGGFYIGKEGGVLNAIVGSLYIVGASTVLGLLGYDVRYVGFGCDLVGCEPADTWAVNWNNGIYQFLQGDRMIQFDGERVTAVYDFKSDTLLMHNLLGGNGVDVAGMELRLKAIIQQYMQRMNGNGLVVRD